MPNTSTYKNPFNSRKSNNNKRIIFTGQSGIDIGCGLASFKEHLDHIHHQYYKSTKEKIEISIFKFEKYLEDVYKKHNKTSTESEDTWIGLLNSPYRQLELWWKEAHALLLNEIGVAENNAKFGHLSLISMHFVFYHGRTNEYISSVNFNQLKKLSPDLIITLIDDIYDIQFRLQQTGKIFFHTAQNTFDQILQLFAIQDWRAKEILTSRIISQNLNKKLSSPKFILLAVKHPHETLNSLLQEKPTAYLSHPISEVRRLQHAKKTEMASELINELRKFYETLQDEFSVFLPTTIDEYRIKEDTHFGQSYLIPRLKPRWDEEYFRSPKGTLFCQSGFFDNSGLWTVEIESDNEIKIQVLDTLLRALKSRIASQVSIRDYLLVEQSDYLVIFRPVFNGNISGGVKEENDYHLTIKEAVEKFTKNKGSRHNIFIYCPKKDILNLIKRKLAFQVEKLIRQKIFTSESNTANRDIIIIDKLLPQDELEKIYVHILNSKSQGRDVEGDLYAIFKRVLYEGDYKFNIDYVIAKKIFEDDADEIIPTGDSSNSALVGSDMNRQKNTTRIILWERFNKSINELYNYKESKIFETKEMSPTDFLAIVKTHLKSPKYVQSNIDQ